MIGPCPDRTGNLVSRPAAVFGDRVILCDIDSLQFLRFNVILRSSPISRFRKDNPQIRAEKRNKKERAKEAKRKARRWAKKQKSKVKAKREAKRAKVANWKAKSIKDRPKKKKAKPKRNEERPIKSKQPNFS